MSEIRANTISDAAGTGPVTLTGQYAAKAWASWNMAGTPAFRSSGNVSSITDNGTGDQTLNFTSALADANGAVVGHILTEQVYVTGTSLNGMQPYSVSSTSVRVRGNFYTGSTNNLGFADLTAISVAIFR
jgi:hypothetical protein